MLRRVRIWRIAVLGAMLWAAARVGSVLIGSARVLPVATRPYAVIPGYPGITYAPYHQQGPRITARSAVLIESVTGVVLFGKNEHARMHPASTTKIMTAILAVELGDMDSEVVVSANAAGTPGSSLYLKKGQRLRLGDLLRATMLRSGNDGCVAIAEHIAGSETEFVRMMNAKARRLGAWNTRFANPHGLTEANHYTTAFDLALMARYGMTFPLFADIVAAPEGEMAVREDGEETWRQLANTNLLLWSFEGADGVKTGTTSAAGYCLVASATRGGVQFIAVVLDSDARWSDCAKLLEYAFDGFRVVDFARKWEHVTTARVRGGVEPEVDLAADRGLRVVVRKDLAHLVEERIILDGAPTAPIRQGDSLGRLVVLFDKDEMASVELVAMRGVARAGAVRAFARGLGRAVRALLSRRR